MIEQNINKYFSEMEFTGVKMSANIQSTQRRIYFQYSPNISPNQAVLEDIYIHMEAMQNTNA